MQVKTHLPFHDWEEFEEHFDITEDDNQNAIRNINNFCDRLKVPNEFRDLAILLVNGREFYIREVSHPWHLGVGPTILEPKHLYSLIQKIDIRKEERLKNFFDCQCVRVGGTTSVDRFWKDFLMDVIYKIKSFKINEEDQKKSNKEIKEIVESAHREIVRLHIKDFWHSNSEEYIIELLGNVDEKNCNT
ncbi:MAG: hypothetical protein ACJ0QT_01920 [Gammaproteobacteria bacterium]